jgi:hypothetical protein
MTPPATEDSSTAWLEKLDWVLLGLIVILSFLVSSVPAFNSDVWMQLATGRLIVEGKYLPGGADPFSCATLAVEGRDAVPWVNHSWLFGLGLFLVYSAVGGAGVIIVKALGIAALTVLLMQIRVRHTSLLPVALCMGLAVPAIGLRLYLQPLLVSYLFLGITLFILHRAGVFDAGEPTDGEALPNRERSLWALPALFILWVNLDGWFILGPIVLALSWAGLALQRWRRVAVRVPVGKLGVVLLVSFAACLINPSHVRAFQLPPELAYLLVRAASAAGVPLPDALVAGGRTLATLAEAEPSGLRVWTLSPLSSEYLSLPALGWNVAGFCFFPLLALGLASFIAMGAIVHKPGAPPMQAGRVLVWLFFAVLAVLMYRLIPFFAIVAAPITALNLGDLAAYYGHGATAAGPSLWGPPARLLRVLGVPVLLTLIALTWLGWLNGPQEIGGQQWRHHVAWDVPADPSMQLAAERLRDIQNARQGNLHVFSTGRDFTPYLAWFAPGVKGFVDTRLSLYPDTAAEFLIVKATLGDPKKAGERTAILRRNGIDHVVVEHFLTGSPYAAVLWMDPAQWRQDFADSEIAIFRWSRGEQRFAADAVLDDWNRRAFGPVSKQDRPLGSGLPPLEPVGEIERYLLPPLALPEPAKDVTLKYAYSAYVSQRALDVAVRTLPYTILSPAGLPLAPGAPPQVREIAVKLRMMIPHETQWRAFDALPPAAPILMARSAARAVVESPKNALCYMSLSDAISTLRSQENYWVAGKDQAPQTVRDRMRRVQIHSALRYAIEAGVPDAASQYAVHRRLADLYAESNFIDTSLEHWILAIEAHEARKPDNPKKLAEWKSIKKDLENRRKAFEKETQNRKKDFAAKTIGRKPLEKVVEALSGEYVQLAPDNRREIRVRRGLASLALQQLAEIDPDKLPERDRLTWGALYLDLLYQLGLARQASELVDDVYPRLGSGGLQYRAYRDAVQGDRDALREFLREWENRKMREMVKFSKTICFTNAMAAPAALGASNAHLCTSLLQWSALPNVLILSTDEYCNVKTLRGIVALEAGDTAEAKRIFDEVLAESSGYYFADRAIAERYAELLARHSVP